jgi:hypothetical protein
LSLTKLGLVKVQDINPFFHHPSPTEPTEPNGTTKYITQVALRHLFGGRIRRLPPAQQRMS